MDDKSKGEKQFNLQVSLPGRSGRILIPRNHAEQAYVEYSARFGTSQSLERLNERGGFEVKEIIQLLCDRISRQEEKIEKLQDNVGSSKHTILSLQRRIRDK